VITVPGHDLRGTASERENLVWDAAVERAESQEGKPRRGFEIGREFRRPEGLVIQVAKKLVAKCQQVEAAEIVPGWKANLVVFFDDEQVATRER
jgi:hypothetical protein